MLGTDGAAWSSGRAFRGAALRGLARGMSEALSELDAPSRGSAVRGRIAGARELSPLSLLGRLELRRGRAWRTRTSRPCVALTSRRRRLCSPCRRGRERTRAQPLAAPQGTENAMDIGNCVPGADRRPPVLLATALAALLWSAAAFAQTPSSCALFGPKQAAELDWTARQTPVPIVDKVLADRLRACFGNEPSEPILRSDLHRLRSLRHQGDHM